MSDLVNYLDAKDSLAQAVRMLGEVNNDRKSLAFAQIGLCKRQLENTVQILNRIMPDSDDAVSRLGYEADVDQSS